MTKEWWLIFILDQNFVDFFLSSLEKNATVFLKNALVDCRIISKIEDFLLKIHKPKTPYSFYFVYLLR